MADCVAAFRPDISHFSFNIVKVCIEQKHRPYSAGLLFCPTKFNNGTRLLIAAQLPR